MDEKIDDERLSGKLCIENIRKWKSYPNYRAEPRVDWILALAIPLLLEKEFHSRCKLLLPEFPLRKGTLDSEIAEKEFNRSVKVDFYCLLEDGNHILSELKTDSNSVNKKQLEYLRKAASIKVHSIFEGLILISDKTKANEKYQSYIKVLQDNGIYNLNNEVNESRKKKFNVVFISPEKIHNVSELQTGMKKIKYYELKDLVSILKNSDDEFIRGIANVISEW
ncbi:hypothetical protein [Clostridium beijerinckii]|uniref:hypothetical protein n=1 Tax=Clostridium beijerinckii TaxID=1520 RepID=UPI000316A97F|nr:hypothetical protein [Clostridium beijerinckii]